MCRYKSFWRCTKCRCQIFGLAQKIWTGTKHFGTYKRTRHKAFRPLGSCLSWVEWAALREIRCHKVQNIWTGTKHFGTYKRTRHQWKSSFGVAQNVYHFLVPALIFWGYLYKDVFICKWVKIQNATSLRFWLHYAWCFWFINPLRCFKKRSIWAYASSVQFIERFQNTVFDTSNLKTGFVDS